jgi:hypothetical protein
VPAGETWEPGAGSDPDDLDTPHQPAGRRTMPCTVPRDRGPGTGTGRCARRGPSAGCAPDLRVVPRAECCCPTLWTILMPRPPRVRAAMLARSAAGRPSRATLRLHLSLDSWRLDVQRGRGGVVPVRVGLADICRDAPRADTEKPLADAHSRIAAVSWRSSGGRAGVVRRPRAAGELPARRAARRYGRGFPAASQRGSRSDQSRSSCPRSQRNWRTICGT